MFDKFTRMAKQIRIIGDPDNQHPDTWSPSVCAWREQGQVTNPWAANRPVSTVAMIFLLVAVAML